MRHFFNDPDAVSVPIPFEGTVASFFKDESSKEVIKQ
jgi:hypothetical protein